ncbi:hypothetical protein [Corynebacterium glutamicum]|uniref:hypothetical protein n=1 Tax=Corynebacterium glutamicum TaxID=1718 RepID=UPI001C8F3561|nr:hypothetical protein [Corynebacterium glutamicum]
MNGLIGSIGNPSISAIVCLVVGTILILIRCVHEFSDPNHYGSDRNLIMDKVINPENSPKATILSNFWSFILGVLFTLMVTASSVTVASMQPWLPLVSLSKSHCWASFWVPTWAPR